VNKILEATAQAESRFLHSGVDAFLEHGCLNVDIDFERKSDSEGYSILHKYNRELEFDDSPYLLDFSKM